MSISMPARRGARAMAFAALLAVVSSCGGGGGGGGGIPIAVDLASVTPNAVQAARSSGAGDFAADYLRSTHFGSLVVEVDYPASRPPKPAALSLLQDRLQERCDKPDGVTILLDDAIPDDDIPPESSVEDLEDLEATYRDFYSDQGTGTAVIYLLYLTGSSNLDGRSTAVLGLSYHGGSIALFVDTAEQGPDPFVTTAEVEGTGIVHECGHLMGLVNGTVPMQVNHEDAHHEAHDADPECVMFWIINVPQLAPNIGDDDFAPFDVHCVEDLEAFGGNGALPLFAPTSRTTPSLLEREPVAVCPECAACAARARAKAR